MKLRFGKWYLSNCSLAWARDLKINTALTDGQKYMRGDAIRTETQSRAEMWL